jgi:lysophospholipase L1-like esterase
MIRYSIIIISMFFISTGLIGEKNEKPTLFIIGDSTVKNGNGIGGGGLWGWGDFMYEQLDTTKISIRNFARGGRSSRTFISEGLWDVVLAKIQPGDFVIMQFGHNDGGAVNDSTRARGTIRGTGEETQEINNIITKKHEVVHSFGWYMRKYIADTKAKGAIPIVCSLIPRNDWKEGKVIRLSDSYGKWASDAAKTGGAFFIDLNEIIAVHYETIGQSEVTSKFFLTEHTHTTKAGAQLNASSVAEGIRSLKECRLSSFLLK